MAVGQLARHAFLSVCLCCLSLALALSRLLSVSLDQSLNLSLTHTLSLSLGTHKRTHTHHRVTDYSHSQGCSDCVPPVVTVAHAGAAALPLHRDVHAVVGVLLQFGDVRVAEDILVALVEVVAVVAVGKYAFVLKVSTRTRVRRVAWRGSGGGGGVSWCGVVLLLRRREIDRVVVWLGENKTKKERANRDTRTNGRNARCHRARRCRSRHHRRRGCLRRRRQSPCERCTGRVCRSSAIVASIAMVGV
jgi:hypothetical protein